MILLNLSKRSLLRLLGSVCDSQQSFALALAAMAIIELELIFSRLFSASSRLAQHQVGHSDSKLDFRSSSGF